MAEGSLGQLLTKASRRYSSLFRLPSYRDIVLLVILMSIASGVLSVVIFLPATEGLFKGVILGVSLFVATLLSDQIVGTIILREDAIYDPRRLAAVSLFCWGLWALFILAGVLVALSFGALWVVRLCLLGFSAVVIFRLIILSSTSVIGKGRLLAASLSDPLLCLGPFLLLWEAGGLPVVVNVVAVGFYLPFSVGVAVLSSFLFLYMLNHVGERAVGIPSLSLLKAFLLNWILGVNEPLEEFLEQLGEEQDIEVSLLRFDSTRPKAMVVVPSVHPGPFRNVGSSVLPSMIKKVLEKDLGCTVCVPHGLFGHELDLASQAQNQRLISRITNPDGFESTEAKATPFVSVAKGVATASCQVFGEFAFVSFTLAPHMTEDLPQELGVFVRQEAKKRGWTRSLVVDAHNSLDGSVDAEKALEDLRSATTACFVKAASEKLLPFGIGAATVMPNEFGLQEGMGSGGISVIIVQVGSQKAAYVVIDGNNMVSGLREQILMALRSVGVNDGEVFTTDSHEVSAITLNDRGYSPLGEAIDRGKLTDYVVKATLDAVGDLESARATRHATVTVPKVKVIGKRRLETLCLLIDKALQRARRSIAAIAAVDGLVLMLALMII